MKFKNSDKRVFQTIGLDLQQAGGTINKSYHRCKMQLHYKPSTQQTCGSWAYNSVIMA